MQHPKVVLSKECLLSFEAPTLDAKIFLEEKLMGILVPAIQELQKAVVQKQAEEANPSLPRTPELNPINWLAALLMRHNPKYNPSALRNPYYVELQATVKALKEQLAKLKEAEKQEHLIPKPPPKRAQDELQKRPSSGRKEASPKVEPSSQRCIVIPASSAIGFACVQELTSKFTHLEVSGAYPSASKAKGPAAQFKIVPSVGINPLVEDTLGKVFDGHGFAIIITPDEGDAGQACTNMINAALTQGVPHIIYISTWTAGALRNSSGRPAHCRAAEDLLRSSKCRWTIVRGGFPMDTFLSNSEEVRTHGRLLGPDFGFGIPYVDTRDIGKCAAAIVGLCQKSFEGKVFECSGPAKLNLEQAAAVFGKALEKSIVPVAMPPAMVRDQCPPELAEAYGVIGQVGDTCVPFASDIPLMGRLGTLEEWVTAHKAVFIGTDEHSKDDVNENIDAEKAATSIQAGIRGHITRKKVKQQKEKETQAATNIQSQFRGYKVRKQLTEKQKPETPPQEQNPEFDAIEDSAAIKIQAGIRGHITRKQVKQRKADAKQRQLQDEQYDTAAVKIQAGIRGHITRKQMKKQKASEAEPKEDPQYDAAAVKIQAGIRGHITRKQMKKQKESNTTMKEDDEPQPQKEIQEGKEYDAAAAKIQAGIRGHITRKQMKQQKMASPPRDEEPQAKQDVEYDLAAAKIQAGIRGHITRKQMKQQKMASPPRDEGPQAKQDVEYDVAAARIQAGIRGHITRKQVKKQKAEETKAATSIQAQFRGHRARKGASFAPTSKSQGDARAETASADANENDNGKDETDDESRQAAATKIQAGMRGRMARKMVKEQQKESVADKTESPGDSQRAAGDDQEHAAATKIQAGMRGRMARKRAKEVKSQSNTATGDAKAPNDEELMQDYILQQELAIAATKIQAGIRGSIARRRVRHLKETAPSLDELLQQNPDEPQDEGEIPEEIHQELDEQYKAAVKIQAGIKGYLARKKVEHTKKVESKKVTKENVEESPQPDTPAPEESPEAALGDELAILQPALQNAVQHISDVMGFHVYVGHLIGEDILFTCGSHNSVPDPLPVPITSCPALVQCLSGDMLTKLEQLTTPEDHLNIPIKALRTGTGDLVISAVQGVTQIVSAIYVDSMGDEYEPITDDHLQIIQAATDELSSSLVVLVGEYALSCLDAIYEEFAELTTKTDITEAHIQATQHSLYKCACEQIARVCNGEGLSYFTSFENGEESKATVICEAGNQEKSIVGLELRESTGGLCFVLRSTSDQGSTIYIPNTIDEPSIRLYGGGELSNPGSLFLGLVQDDQIEEPFGVLGVDLTGYVDCLREVHLTTLGKICGKLGEVLGLILIATSNGFEPMPLGEQDGEQMEGVEGEVPAGEETND